MLKKMVVLAAVGFVAVAALGGTKIGSYIRSEIRAARERAEENIPPEKEVARLRNELKLLDKDIMTVVNQLAKERVEVNQLKEKTDDLAAKQSKDKELLESRANLIKGCTGDQLQFGTRAVSVSAAKGELEEGVKRYAANQKSLDSFNALLANRTKVRDALEKQLETMKAQKAELTAAVDAMEAELTMLKLQQMESKYQTDDTRLAKIKEDLRKLKTKVDVEREKLKLMPAAFDAPAAPASGGKSVDDIMAPVTGSGPAKTAKPADTSKTETKLPLAD